MENIRKGVAMAFMVLLDQRLTVIDFELENHYNNYAEKWGIDNYVASSPIALQIHQR